MGTIGAMQLDLLVEIAEAKRIYTAIDYLLLESKGACLLVTSACRSEGKTVLAAGLARLAAEWSSKRVLVMDLNWYAAALHTAFGIEQTFDVHSLTDARAVANLALPWRDDHLHILTAPRLQTADNWKGPDNSLLGLEIVRQARENYDLTIIDMPSVFPTNRHMMDPLVLSRGADGTLMVVLANITPRQKVKRAVMMLGSSGAKVMGAVVNQWKNPLA